MIVGNSFHTHNVNRAVETTQNSVKPVEKISATDSNQSRQNKQQPDSSSLNSLGQGRLV